MDSDKIVDNILQKIKEKKKLCKRLERQRKQSNMENTLIKCKRRLLQLEITLKELRQYMRNKEMKNKTVNTSTQVTFSKEYLNKLATEAVQIFYVTSCQSKPSTCKACPTLILKKKATNYNLSTAKSKHTQCKEQQFIATKGKAFAPLDYESNKIAKSIANKCAVHALEYLKNKREHKRHVQPSPPCERCKKKEISNLQAKASTICTQDYTYDDDLQILYFNRK